jgi:Glycosyl transferases group 1
MRRSLPANSDEVAMRSAANPQSAAFRSLLGDLMGQLVNGSPLRLDIHFSAIRIARALGIPLKIAAKIDKVDESYFREKIVPLLSDPGVEFIGEINERSKAEFLGEAQALLFPIDWPEPFGLVMIEAMACGTPVLAFRHGSVSEIIDQGVTGAIVDTADEAVRMLPRVIALDRRAVRRRFEQRFSSTGMAKDYVAVYRSLLKRPSISERETAVPMPRPYWKKSRTARNEHDWDLGDERNRGEIVYRIVKRR